MRSVTFLLDAQKSKLYDAIYQCATGNRLDPDVLFRGVGPGGGGRVGPGPLSVESGWALPR
jgi:hypothetical protein